MENDDYTLRINQICQNIENDLKGVGKTISDWECSTKQSIEDFGSTIINRYLSRDKSTIDSAREKMEIRLKNARNEFLAKQERLADLTEEETNINVNMEAALCNIQDLEAFQVKRSKKEEDYRQFLRDSVKFAKVMTCTAFNYKVPTITGVISRNDTTKVFDINPITVKQDAVANHMWEILTKMSGEDWSDILD